MHRSFFLRGMIHIFDHSRFGRVSRREYFIVLAAHLLILAVTLYVPVEIAYQLEFEPDGEFLLASGMGWFALLFVSVRVLLRFSARRLTDSGCSRGWLWLIVFPILGWTALSVLLSLPTRN